MSHDQIEEISAEEIEAKLYQSDAPVINTSAEVGAILYQTGQDRSECKTDGQRAVWDHLSKLHSVDGIMPMYYFEGLGPARYLNTKHPGKGRSRQRKKTGTRKANPYRKATQEEVMRTKAGYLTLIQNMERRAEAKFR